jgi:hypothetical protein
VGDGALVLLALGEQRDLAIGQALAQLQEARHADHVGRLGPAQEVAGQVRGHRHLDPADLREQRDVDREVGEDRLVGQAYTAGAGAEFLDRHAGVDREGQRGLDQLLDLFRRDLRHRSPRGVGLRST